MEKLSLIAKEISELEAEHLRLFNEFSLDSPEKINLNVLRLVNIANRVDFLHHERRTIELLTSCNVSVQ